MESLHLAVILIVVAVCITAIEITAMILGIDGTYLSAVVGIFTGIIGVVGKTMYDRRE